MEKRKDKASYRRHFKIKRRAKPGASPGTLIADPNASQTSLELISYNKNSVSANENCTLNDIKEEIKNNNSIWINIYGLSNVGLIKEIGELFGLHLLALEDVVNHHQRPKADIYNDHILLTTVLVKNNDINQSQQLSIVLGKNYVITFHESKDEYFQPILKRLNSNTGKFNTEGSSYLAYAIIDLVIDNYFPMLENYGEQLEEFEENIINSSQPENMERLHYMKHNLLAIRRILWPQREMLSLLIREDSAFFNDNTKLYLRDCYDHIIQLMDIVETYREIASGLVDIYLSSISNHMNEVMKVLTIIATIFIPLTFIAGVYGMNFDRAFPLNMPELSWEYGYIYSLGIMFVVAVILIYLFCRKGWIHICDKLKIIKLK